MNLYLISQYQNVDYGHYDNVVVCAPDAETAQSMHPETGEVGFKWPHLYPDESGLIINWSETDWCWAAAPEHVQVVFLGKAAPSMEQGVVCSSFISD